MYEALQEIPNLMDGMTNRNHPQSAEYGRRVESALAVTAQQVDASLRETEDETRRRRLQAIYRGLLATRRAVVRLNEIGMDLES